MLRELIPAKYRKVFYIVNAVLGGLAAVEQIVDVVPGNVEVKVLAVLSLLGFTLAAVNTTDVTVVSDNDPLA